MQGHTQFHSSKGGMQIGFKPFKAFILVVCSRYRAFYRKINKDANPQRPINSSQMTKV